MYQIGRRIQEAKWRTDSCPIKLVLLHHRANSDNKQINGNNILSTFYG
jgi:hypothetical protein